ncbi:MAG: repair protein RecN [Clostridia bacterium]|jgi:DNA repair protein RecN (Recombination protein N)|nr:repair protein RecN [Clostridia bacterium]MDN5323070.1 repair protein RecN [Clostridia bacterium]
MLIQLSIKDFALIDNLNMEFDGKFNVLTGETGAGKSIIIDAVSLLLGARGQSDFIRVTKEKAIVEGTFLIPKKHPLEKKLKEYGFDLEIDDHLLILTREISLTGKNICRVNNRIVTLSVFKEIGSQLIDIYGQHDFQSLSQSENHIFLLDSMGNESFQNLLNTVKENYNLWQYNKKQLDKLLKQVEDKSQRLDLLKFQVAEINNLNLKENEYEDIQSELTILNNWEKIYSIVNEGYELLYGNNSAYDKISQVIDKLKEISLLDNLFAEMADNLQTAVYHIEDSARALKDYGENFSFDNERKEYLQERKFAIDKLKRKYGGTIKEILDFKNKTKKEIQELENCEFIIEKLENTVKESENNYLKSARELSNLRKKLAAELEEKIIKQLNELAMPHTKFHVQIEPVVNSLRGIDKVEFLISPNPGEPLKPLAKIASGGEMSRIMLAFKVILANSDQLTTLIFDEIDSGIGGHVVNKVAEKLFYVSNFNQVLCVTHSPNIASFAHQHYKISKIVKENKTTTQVAKLNEQERIYELARMLGGNEEITYNHALEMRKKAKNK